jgi:hypothetical protein
MMHLVAERSGGVVSPPPAFAEYIRRTLLTEVSKRAVLRSRDCLCCWKKMVWLDRCMRMRKEEGGVRVQVVEGEDTAVGGVNGSPLQG